jgi:hypothetical protein
MLDLLIHEHEQISSKTRARRKRGAKGIPKDMVHMEKEEKSRSPNAVEETKIHSVEGLQITRSPPDLSLEEFGWVECLGGGRA